MKGDDIFKSAQKSAPASVGVNEKQLNEVSTFFDSKAQKGASLLLKPLSITDPSL